jgi:hypothetical protein
MLGQHDSCVDNERMFLPGDAERLAQRANVPQQQIIATALGQIDRKEIRGAWNARASVGSHQR